MDGIGKEFAGTLEARTVEQTTPEAERVIAEAGFRKQHGLVLRDAEGAIVFKYDGHDITPDEIRAAVAKVVR